MSTTLKLKLKKLAFVPAAGVAALVLLAHGATAQSATGSITGRVLWGNCIRAIPLPGVPDAQAPASDAQSRTQTNGLPAGAVLVAVQSTSVNARTDETGHFSLSGVPAGQYLTVAAGPVANALQASAARPNVFVDGGQSVDIGTLSLGGGGLVAPGIACRVLPPVAVPDAGQDLTAPQPANP